MKLVFNLFFTVEIYFVNIIISRVYNLNLILIYEIMYILYPSSKQFKIINSLLKDQDETLILIAINLL